MFKKRINEQFRNNVHIAEGNVTFHQIQLNTISFATDGIIIDAAAASVKSLFTPFWEKHKVDGLYCTHIHEDHTGCASWFEKEKGVPIFLSDRSGSEARRKGSYPLYRRFYWGTRLSFNPISMPESFESRTSKWRSIPTPGHSYDHMSLLNESTGQLFSGDLYVQTKTKVVMKSESIPTIIDSLKKVLQFDFDDVFCSHAGYLPRGRTQLLNKLQYLQEIQERVLTLHKQGLTAKDIQRRLFSRTYPITFFSYGQWDSKHIITSILTEASSS
ncbi:MULTISPECIES: MBL fold metallo-hydrolase [Bacillaceae]|uniref:MBL fold metallo-hydrolase n=1 Tax=Alkalicoccobacillus plakortidis TaxID=444060 RepID=A0A9D5I040_9BACI|nr:MULTISPECIES: MBL fold metallo-hydrolase [Bacillaceae]KQL56589.1 MBL fold metallo-hydrolase [Alkalicoccobacillus plakortidis]